MFRRMFFLVGISRTTWERKDHFVEEYLTDRHCYPLKFSVYLCSYMNCFIIFGLSAYWLMTVL